VLDWPPSRGEELELLDLKGRHREERSFLDHKVTGEEGEKARRQPSVSSGTFCQSGKGQHLEISEVRMLT